MRLLLLVEDDPALARALRNGLLDAGFVIDNARSLDEATALRHANNYDLVILDLGLPDGDGGDWLAELRARDSPLPVLILTARGTVTDRVAGLNAGADDYLLKPFAFPELVARVRALLRRPTAAAAPVLRIANVEFNPDRLEVRSGGDRLS